MRAFDIQGDKVTFTPEFLAVPEFKFIWNRDRTKSKAKAVRELSFVVFLCDNSLTNPYSGYSEELREEILKEDFIGDKEWSPDEKIKLAIDKFNALLETPSSRLVSSALIAADKLNGYYRTVDFTLTDDNGKPLFSAKEFQGNIKDLAATIKSLYALREQLKKEQLDDNIARGGSEIGMFELPD